MEREGCFIPKTRIPPRLRRGNRGVALVLVMTSVAMALILGIAFLTTSSTTSAVVSTAEDFYRARQIAESGLDMMVHYVNKNTAWRNDRTPGIWVTNQPLAGGFLDVNADFTEDATAPLTFTVTGRFAQTRQTLEATVVPTGSAWGVALKNALTVKNNAFIDSFDSAGGAYSVLTASPSATVSTDATYAGAVQLENFGYVKGNLWIGKGGNPSSVVVQAPTATVTGEIKNMSWSIFWFLGPKSAPSGTGTNQGDVTLSSGTTQITSHKQYDSLTLAGTARLRINGDVKILVNETFTLQDHAVLEIRPGSKLQLYVRQGSTFSNFAQANYDSAPQPFVLYAIGSGYEHIVQNQTHIAMTFYGPTAKLKLQNGGQMYGLCLAESLTVQDGASFHADRSFVTAGLDFTMPLRVTGAKIRRVIEK